MANKVLLMEDVVIYQDQKVILSDVNLELESGGFCYLIGKTGSGKSSLMKTLYADIPLKEGEARIVDFNLRNLKEKEIPFLRRKIGIVFQDFKLLLEKNVFDNLAFVLRATGWKDKKRINERINEVLNMVGLTSKLYAKTFELSGGEQQRLAIARALLNDPELILADEPTGNLDPRTSLEIMSLLVDINKKGTAILMATHDYSMIMKHDFPTVKCENGKLFEVVRQKSPTV
ncbi:MAG: phosphonate ABC transporter ATP-binding protein [Flavobacteriia bacterium]|nr:MAG: phosphonate ABC transporter ATP-binding protein [Flavobacteriia bacterium]